jgi:hypothetical protein
MNSTKLKIALIVDSINVSKYVFDLVLWANNQDNVTISHLIIQDLPKKNKKIHIIIKLINYLKKKGVKSIIQEILWLIINKVEVIKLRKLPTHADHLTSKSLATLVEKK